MGALGGNGKHRLSRVPLRPAARAGIGVAFLASVGIFAVTWPSSAGADAPVQTGWWNTASGGGQSAPSSTADGAMHIGATPGSVSAIAGVVYPFPVGGTGTLVLNVSNLVAAPDINPSAPSTTPAVNVIACPAKESWKAGGDQPMDDAPAFDCKLRTFVGTLSTDQKSMSFLVDDTGQPVPGQLNLILTPVTTDAAPGVGTTLPVDTTSPMALDFDKPDASSLAATPPFSPPGGSGGGDTGGDSTGSDGGSTSSSGSGSGTTGTGGSTSGTSSGSNFSIPPPVASGDLPGATTTDAGGAPPVVAPTTTAPAATPAAAVLPKKSDTAHNAALGLLILLGLAMLMTANAGAGPRTPRLLGGAGRHAARSGSLAMATAGAGAAAATAPDPAAVAATMTAYGMRGLGRFNKPRTEAPRPLI